MSDLAAPAPDQALPDAPRAPAGILARTAL